MREFIGHEVEFYVEGQGIVKGTVINDAKDRIFVKRADGKVSRVIKLHICSFTPLDCEPEEYIPFHILHCWNKNTGCPGVRFVLEGEGFRAKDFEVFMEPCPCHDESCSYGTKGEIHSVPGTFLRETFADTIYGEYPKKKKEAKGGPSGRPDEETERSPSEGARADAGEEQDNRRVGRPEEASGGAGEEG